MKRTLTHIALVLTTLLALSSCSHNNGDIGYWFGLWHLDTIEVDGVPDDGYDGNYYFMFQGKIFCIRWINEQQHEYIESFAKWQESDDGKTMTVNFIDNRFTPQVGEYLPANYLSTVTHFNVVTLNADDMVLTTTAPESGATVTYHLTRLR